MRQDGLLGYAQPFLVRLSSPGWFETECGAISSITFKKGGDDDLWTLDNLPNEIEVTLSIVDLYPSLVSTNSFGVLAYNSGLSSFLECMAGVRFDQLNALLKLEAFAKNRLSTVQKIWETPKNAFQDWMYERKGKLSNILR